MADRITQQAIEVLQQPHPLARVTQEVIEVLQLTRGSVIVTQEAVEILWHSGATTVQPCPFVIT